jgi:hypothetical protein
LSNLILFSLLILLLVVVQFSRGMTSRRLLNLHLEAVGGKSRVHALQRILLAGQLKAYGQAGSFKADCRRNAQVRVDVELPGQGSATLLMGQGKAEKRILLGETALNRPLLPGEWPFVIDGIDFFGTFFLFRRSQSTLQYLGREPVDGLSCFKLSSVNPDGGRSFHFLRCDTLLQVRVIRQISQNGMPFDSITDFSDFRPLPSGFVFPHQISMSGFQLTLEEISLH